MSKYGVCSVCGVEGEKTGPNELRPYGPGGSLICAGCGMSPARAKETKQRLEEHLGRVSAGNAVVVIEPGRAPYPYAPEGGGRGQS